MKYGIARTLQVMCCGLALLGSASAWPEGLATPGCGRSPPATGSYALVHGGIRRHYRLVVPPGYDRRRPARLVLAFHGWGGDEREFADDHHFVAEASRRGYVLAVPRGLGSGLPDDNNNAWTFRGSATGVVDGAPAQPICDASITPDYRYRSCRNRVALNTCSWTQCQDNDVAFVRDLVAHLERQLCIDPKNVYAAGGSNGGMFTWELGMNPATAPLFRAIAPIIGLPHAGDERPPGKPGGMPVLLVTGLRDPVVPPGAWDDPSPTTTSNDSDRFHYTSATAITRVWSAADRCVSDEHRVDSHAASVECRTSCDAGQGQWPAVLDCRAAMGHDYGLRWASKLLFDFFDAF